MQETAGISDLFLDSPSPFTSRWPDGKLNRLSHTYLSGRGGFFSLPPHRRSCPSLPDPSGSSAFPCTFPNYSVMGLPPACCRWSAASRREKQLIFTPINKQPGLTRDSQGRSHSIRPTHQDVSLQWLLTTAVLFDFPAFFQEVFASQLSYETESLRLCISSRTLNQSRGKSPQLSFCSHCRLMAFSCFGGEQCQYRGALGTSAPCISVPKLKQQKALPTCSDTAPLCTPQVRYALTAHQGSLRAETFTPPYISGHALAYNLFSVTLTRVYRATILGFYQYYPYLLEKPFYQF